MSNWSLIGSAPIANSLYSLAPEWDDWESGWFTNTFKHPFESVVVSLEPYLDSHISHNVGFTASIAAPLRAIIFSGLGAIQPHTRTRWLLTCVGNSDNKDLQNELVSWVLSQEALRYLVRSYGGKRCHHPLLLCTDFVSAFSPDVDPR